MQRPRPAYPRAEESLCTQQSPAPSSSPGSRWGWQLNRRTSTIQRDQPMGLQGQESLLETSGLDCEMPVDEWTG